MSEVSNIVNDLRDVTAKAEGVFPGKPLLELADINYGGVEHGLTQYVYEVILYEDVDKWGITGYISLLDVDNIVSGFLEGSPAGGPHAIVGQELLYLKFRTFGSDFPVDFSKHPLHIHKIEDLKGLDLGGQGASSVGAQTYRIHFVSPELLNNDRVRVSQAYEGTYSDIVKDIMKTHLKTKKDVWVEETKDIIKVVIPNLHPYDAIATMAFKSVNNTGKPNYNFYETTKGFRFKTLHIQAGSGKPGRPGGTDFQMYYTIPSGLVDGNYLRHMHSTVQDRFLRTGDTYAQIGSGMFSSKSIEHDSYHKVVHHGSARYTEDLPERNKLRKMLHITKGSVYVPTGETFSPQVPADNIPKWHESIGYDEFPDSKIFYRSTSGNNKWEGPGPNGVVSTGSLGDPNQLTRNLWTMQQLHDRYTALQIRVYGLSGLQVGDSIALDTPVRGTDNTKRQDKRWGANYYIMQLVHRMDLSVDNPMYYQDLVISPKGPVIKYPDNGYHNGSSDSRTGEMKDFSRQLER
jgi:hypothetical protein